jgi:hypothetical protein
VAGQVGKAGQQQQPAGLHVVQRGQGLPQAKRSPWKPADPALRRLPTELGGDRSTPQNTQHWAETMKAKRKWDSTGHSPLCWGEGKLTQKGAHTFCFWGYCNKNPTFWQLPTTQMLVSQFWRLQVLSQAAGWAALL